MQNDEYSTPSKSHVVVSNEEKDDHAYCYVHVHVHKKENVLFYSNEWESYHISVQEFTVVLVH